MNVHGTNLSQLTNNDEITDSGAALSPDGSKIAFVSNRDGNSEIYVMDADGKNVLRLTNNEMTDDDPDWSPDGNWILFQSNRHGNFGIYAVSRDGNNEIRLTTNPASSDINPVWSKSVSITTNNPAVGVTLDPDISLPP